MSRVLERRRYGDTSKAGNVTEVYPSVTGAQNHNRKTTSDGSYPASEADTRSGYCSQCGSPHEDLGALSECTECGATNFRGRTL